MSHHQSPLLRGQGLPPFQEITPELVHRDIPVLLKQLDQDFTAFEDVLNDALSAGGCLTWSTVMDPLQRLGARLQRRVRRPRAHRGLPIASRHQGAWWCVVVVVVVVRVD